MILGGPSCRCTFAHGRHELRGHGQLQGGHMQPVASRTPGGVVGCSFWLSSSLRTPVPACAASLALQVCAQPLAHALACALTLAFNVVPLPTTHRHPCHHACPLAPPTRMPCHRPGHPPFQATMANSRQGAPASRDCSRCGCAATGSTAPARTAAASGGTRGCRCRCVHLQQLHVCSIPLLPRVLRCIHLLSRHPCVPSHPRHVCRCTSMHGGVELPSPVHTRGHLPAACSHPQRPCLCSLQLRFCTWSRGAAGPAGPAPARRLPAVGAPRLLLGEDGLQGGGRGGAGRCRSAGGCQGGGVGLRGAPRFGLGVRSALYERVGRCGGGGCGRGGAGGQRAGHGASSQPPPSLGCMPAGVQLRRSAETNALPTPP